jgi:hypothetical protein
MAAENWLIRRAIQALEGLLRRCYGVHEYTDDGDCVFRIALRTAQRDVILQDGVRIRRGDTIAELHLWNEQVPPMPRDGPNMAWGALVDGRVRRSLTLLADHLAAHPHVVAVHGEAAFGCQMGQRQAVRLVRRFGFDIVDSAPRMRTRIRHFCDDFLFWGLTWTFNPSALKGKPFHRTRYYAWISCATLNKRWSSAVRPT